MSTACLNLEVKKVTTTRFRENMKRFLQTPDENHVVLIENRSQPSRYLVDQTYFDDLVKERNSIMATLEILADRDLTNRLLNVSTTLDADVAEGRLLTAAQVFGE